MVFLPTLHCQQAYSLVLLPQVRMCIPGEFESRFIGLVLLDDPLDHAKIHWIVGKTREFQRNIYFCFIDYAKAIDCVDDNKLWKIIRDGNTRSPYLPPAKPVCRSRSKQLEPDKEQ